MDSGVGAFGDGGPNERPFSSSTSVGKKRRPICGVATYLMMRQPDRSQQLCRHGQDISQHVDLEFVKGLVDRRLQQRFQLVQAILDLESRFGILDVSVLVGVWDCVCVVLEAEPLGWRVQQTVFQAGDGLVDEVVDRVDDVVDNGLRWLALFSDASRSQEDKDTHEWCVAQVLGEQRSR
jgi:hypothetical protein